jgi:flagellar FliL protein
MSTAAAATAEIPVEGSKGKSKFVLILVTVLALLAGGGGGAAWFFHQKAATADTKEGGADAKAAKKESGKPPVFSTLDNFTVNLAGGDHVMQLGVVLQLKDEETAEKVKTFLPQIRNGILMLLSSKTAEELQTAEGKKKLIEEILTDTREPLHEDGENVQAILLGSMLIQ